MTDNVCLPDHPVRHKTWYQLVNRLPRAVLLWVSAIGAAWAIGLSDIFGMPMDNMARSIVLGFVGLLFGIKSIEALRGVS